MTAATVPIPKKKGDWAGRYVKLRRNFQTVGGLLLPKGTVMVVRRNFGGLLLEVPQVCKHCGIGQAARIKKVAESVVDLLPDGYTDPVFSDEWLPRSFHADQEHLKRQGVRSRAQLLDQRKYYEKMLACKLDPTRAVLYTVALDMVDWMLGNSYSPTFTSVLND